jgi:hypothetical protein
LGYQRLVFNQWQAADPSGFPAGFLDMAVAGSLKAQPGTITFGRQPAAAATAAPD